MKQYRLIYSRLTRCVFFLLSSFCIFFVTTTHSQVIHHRRLWPWPLPESGPGPPPDPSPSPHNKTTPAVFFFGDSIIDTGNNNNLTTEMRCNFPPYGMDFPFAVATGRFSNGKVASDYISEYLGVKPIVPAYFDPNVQPEDLLTGVSFASESKVNVGPIDIFPTIHSESKDVSRAGENRSTVSQGLIHCGRRQQRFGYHILWSRCSMAQRRYSLLYFKDG